MSSFFILKFSSSYGTWEYTYKCTYMYMFCIRRRCIRRSEGSLKIPPPALFTHCHFPGFPRCLHGLDSSQPPFKFWVWQIRVNVCKCARSMKRMYVCMDPVKKEKSFLHAYFAVLSCCSFAFQWLRQRGSIYYLCWKKRGSGIPLFLLHPKKLYFYSFNMATWNWVF